MVSLADMTGDSRVGELGADSSFANFWSQCSGQAGGQSQVSLGSWLTHCNGAILTPTPERKERFSENVFRRGV